MRGIVFTPSGGVRLECDLEKPSRGHGDALIKVLRAGICSTDLEITKGYSGYSGILGHEFVGRVEEVDDGNDRHLKPGDRVVGDINVVCNSCDVCKRGGVMKRNHCSERSVMGILGKEGTWCDYLTLPVDNLYKVPDGITDDVAVFAEPLAAAFRIVEQELVSGSDSVAVVGDGKLGLLVAEVMAACVKPKKVTAFGRHEEKLALLPAGVDKVVVNSDTAKTFQNCFDVVVEATGSPSGLMMSADLTRPMGTLVLKTTCAVGATDFNTACFVIKEIRVIGSRCGNFEMALKALEDGSVKPQKLITKVYPISEAVRAFEHAKQKGVLKILLSVD